MHILDYIGYLCLYGYLIFGFIYFGLKFYNAVRDIGLENIDMFSPRLNSMSNRKLNKVFNEIGIKKIEDI